MMSEYENQSTDDSDNRLMSEMRVYYGPSHNAVLHGFSVDLSAGGLYLKTDYSLPVDEDLVLEFSLPDKEKMIQCKARVAWVNSLEKPCKPELPPGVGIQFVDMSLDDMKAIRRFLEYNTIEPKW